MTNLLASLRGNIAYFSMEVGITEALPTYSGGLGILAGDTLRAAADLALPMCGVTLLYRKGYFRQKLDEKGRQSEAPLLWNPEEHLDPVHETVTITLEGRPVKVRGWVLKVHGARGHVVPIYFLDTHLPENDPHDQTLTDQLYGGDDKYRLEQEAVLGLGGVAFLKALGHPPAAKLPYDAEGTGGEAAAEPGISVYHMNEGHSSLLTLALLREKAGEGADKAASEDIKWVRDRTVFTTHTPVPAGHDTFPTKLVGKVLGQDTAKLLTELEVCPEGRLNMSHLAIRFSRYVNGVAKRHAEVSQRMFPGTSVRGITNGVHAVSWTADAMRDLFDKHVPAWREDNAFLRHACEIPLRELRDAHDKAKRELFYAIEERQGVRLDDHAFTVGFARRATEYKRADLLFHDIKSLKALATPERPLQIIYAGKAHPKDQGGKALIERVLAGANQLKDSSVRVVYVENYDMALGRLICSGVDLWLNNPVKPLEASGTSGMKAAINGIPSLSTLDGWWIEGCVEGVTGWEIRDRAYAFGKSKDSGEHRAEAAASLYRTLQDVILPVYYDDPERFAWIMRNAIVLNGPFFNTHRMMLQYVTDAYTSSAEG